MARRRAGLPRPARDASLWLCLALVAGGCSPPGQSRVPYPDRITAHRSAKDTAFRTERDSPVPPDKHGEFLPLAYFAVDERFVVPAMVTPSEREPAVEMPTSTGQRRRMRRAGTLKFSLLGQPQELTAFVEETDRALERLFVPFGDLTNGTETYPAGRYLDLTRNASGLYEIDFNLAYQPYCYYNPTYDCPFPPAENRLQAPIRAGERMR
jgi:uncharacterized protein (DUF1684 family)